MNKRTTGMFVALTTLTTAGATAGATAPPSTVSDPPAVTGRIAYGRIMPGQEHTDQLLALYAIDADGTDEVQLTEGNSYGPAWSPDGSLVAFTLVAEDGSSHVATVAPDGTGLQILTTGPGVHEAPSWSPDGTWIAYGHTTEDLADPGFNTVLYRMDADGSNPEPIGDPEAFDYEPKISPDGTEVLFQRWFGDGEPSPLVARDLATGEERIVVEAGGLNPAWSPDGSRIVMQTDGREDGAIWGPLVTIDAGADPSTEVALYPGGADSGGFKPVYSPDGAHIAFGCGQDAGTPDYDEAICIMDADGRDVWVLVDNPGVWDNEVAWGAVASD